MPKVNDRNIYEERPWLNDDVQNREVLKKIVDGGGSEITVEAVTFTENDTYTAPAGKAWSPVTVNVVGGSSDFSTAEVTITCDNENAALDGYVGFSLRGFAISQNHETLVTKIGSPANTPLTWNVVLWNGYAEFDVSADPSTFEVAVTGNIEYSDGIFSITGDGTITISAE